MVLWFQMWMVGGQVTPLTAIGGKASLGTGLSFATSTIPICFVSYYLQNPI